MVCYLDVSSIFFSSFVFLYLTWTNNLVLDVFPVVYIERRGFTIAQDGLTFIGVGIGTTIGTIINHYTSAHYPELIKKWKGFPPPEDRLFGAMIGSPLLVIGIFWLGWTGEYASIPWYVPAISTIFLGAGICLIFISFLVCWQPINLNISITAHFCFHLRATSSIHICRFCRYI